MEIKTVRRIRKAVREGVISIEFTSAQVNTALGINWAGTFLPIHRIGNPGGNTELFIQISRGLYKLKTITGG